MTRSKKTPPKSQRTAFEPFESAVNEPLAAYGAATPPMPLDQVRSLGEHYDMAIRDLADILEVTPKTFHRWSLAGEVLTPQQSDRITILETIFALGERVFRSQATFAAWLRQPVLDLGGRSPLEMVKTESGRRAVENILHKIEFGIY